MIICLKITRQEVHDTMAATEKNIRHSLQYTLFGYLHDKSACEPGSARKEEYNNAYHANQATKLLEYVGHGRQNDAATIIKRYPDVLLRRPLEPVRDIAGNLYSGTAFQYALWAMDTRMYTMMLDCLPPDEQGEKIRGSLLQQFEGLTEHFDFHPLLKALQAFVNNFDAWEQSQKDRYWCQVVGGAQCGLPAHVRHEYCNPRKTWDEVWPNLPGYEGNFDEHSILLHDESVRYDNWLIWDENLSGLGSDFAIYRSTVYGREKLSGACCRHYGKDYYARDDLQMLTALCEQRTADLVAFKQRLQIPIQKIDGVDEVINQNISCCLL